MAVFSATFDNWYLFDDIKVINLIALQKVGSIFCDFSTVDISLIGMRKLATGARLLWTSKSKKDQMYCRTKQRLLQSEMWFNEKYIWSKPKNFDSIIISSNYKSRCNLSCYPKYKRFLKFLRKILTFLTTRQVFALAFSRKSIVTIKHWTRCPAAVSIAKIV